MPRVDIDRLAAGQPEALGWFIQPLTAITIHEPVKPVSTIGIPLSMCARGDSRSQP